VSLKFLIVEDETLLRQLVVADVQKKYPGCKVVEAGSLAELKAIDDAGLGQVNLAIVDLELPDGNALDWIEAYAARKDAPKVMVLSSISGDFLLFKALRTQLSGFIHKNDGRESLILGIEMILSGNLFYSPTVQRLRRAMHSAPAFFNKILSEKEQQILRLIGEGHSNEQIAEIEGTGYLTIKDHRKNIMNKLDIHTAPELIRYAIQKGFAQI
jgi:DNA-binding NarL/FixJ family response regulator